MVRVLSLQRDGKSDGIVLPYDQDLVESSGEDAPVAVGEESDAAVKLVESSAVQLASVVRDLKVQFIEGGVWSNRSAGFWVSDDQNKLEREFALFMGILRNAENSYESYLVGMEKVLTEYKDWIVMYRTQPKDEDDDAFGEILAAMKELYGACASEESAA